MQNDEFERCAEIRDEIQTVRCHRKEIKGVMNLVLGGSDPKAAMGLAALATAMTMGTLNEVQIDFL